MNPTHKIKLVLGIVLVLMACNPAKRDRQSSAIQQKSAPSTAIGGGRDEQGCLPAAGERWSQLRQSCIQVFAAGRRLDPLRSHPKQAVFSAFIVKGTGDARLELFLPDQAASIVLNKTADKSYRQGRYRFEPADSSLYIDQQKTYQVSRDKETP